MNAETSTRLEGFINSIYRPSGTNFTLGFVVQGAEGGLGRQISVSYDYPRGLRNLFLTHNPQNSFLVLYSLIHQVVRGPDDGVVDASLTIKGNLEDDKERYEGAGGWEGISLG